jgi:hypothetical protein
MIIRSTRFVGWIENRNPAFPSSVEILISAKLQPSLRTHVVKIIYEFMINYLETAISKVRL